MLYNRFGFALLILCVFAAPVYASMLEAYSGAIAGNNTCPQGGGPPAGMNAFFGALTFGIGACGNGISDSGFQGSTSDVFQATGTASSSTSLTNASFDGGFDSFSGSGSAAAQYGLVTAGASGTVTGISGSGTAESVGYAIATDTMNFSPNGTGNGTTGYVVLHYTINGSLTMNPPDFGEDAMVVAVQLGSLGPQRIFYSVASEGAPSLEGEGGSSVPGCTSGGSYPSVAAFVSCTNGQIQTSMLPVTFNTPTTVGLGLFVGATPFADGTTIDPGTLLTGITLYNANSQVISDFTITSGSGTQYGADGLESSPEPATLLLAAGALTALAWARRRRRTT